MALYYLNISCISRGKGKSAVAVASYITGEKLYNKYNGKIYDFTNRSDILYKNILLPLDAPSKFLDRQFLWNAVEQVEKRYDSRLAREVRIALPNELLLPEQIRLVENYIKDCFLSIGMCADFAIHSGVKENNKNPNPHAHILLTTREVNHIGFERKKCREWDKRLNAIKWRREWANVQNREFERKNLPVRVSHESYYVQGLDIEPNIHLGRVVKELQRQGIRTDRQTEYEAIEARNSEILDRKRRKKERQHEIERSR